MDHLALVVSQSEHNKMSPQNLSVCFGPVLMLQSEGSDKHLDFHQPINALRYLLEIWPVKSGTVPLLWAPTLMIKNYLELHKVYSNSNFSSLQH